MIVDCFMHSYEADAVEVRLAELDPVVDLFVAVQGKTTLRYEPREVRLIKHPKAVNHVVDIPPGLTPFQGEEFLRDECLRAGRVYAASMDASHTNERARFMVCDGDEIPHPAAVVTAAEQPGPRTLLTDYREWFMDWRGPDKWQLERQPTIATALQYKSIGGAARARRHCRQWTTERLVGWHLSTLGDAGLASRKLSTFSHPEFDTPEYNDHDRLAGFRSRKRDLLDRFDLEDTRDLPSTSHLFPHLLSYGGGTW